MFRLNVNVFSYSKGHLKHLTICTILATWLRLAEGTVTPVTRCPTCQAEWTERALNMSCDERLGLHYHCILDTEDNLLELCLAKRPISPGKEGCPLIYHSARGNLIVHEGQNSPCPSNNTYCPASSKTYYTNELYRFPICYHNVTERENYKGECCGSSAESSVHQNECERKNNISKTPLECTCGSTNSMTWISLFTVSVFFNIVLAILLYCTCTKCKASADQENHQNVCTQQYFNEALVMEQKENGYNKDSEPLLIELYLYNSYLHTGP